MLQASLQREGEGGALHRGTLLRVEFNVHAPNNRFGGDMQIPQVMRFVVLGTFYRIEMETDRTLRIFLSCVLFHTLRFILNFLN